MKKVNNKCYVSFDNFDRGSGDLGKTPDRPYKTDESKAISLSNLIRIPDDNPVWNTEDKEVIRKIYNDHISDNKSGYVVRMATFTFNTNRHDQDIKVLEYNNGILQRTIFNKIYNIFKSYESPFVACEEYHKHKRILHIHMLFFTRSNNRIRNIRNNIKCLLGYASDRKTICIDPVKFSKSAFDYITKDDENNINKISGIPDHPKQYYYWIKN